MATRLNEVMQWYEVNLDSHRNMIKLVSEKPQSIPLDSVLTTKTIKQVYKYRNCVAHGKKGNAPAFIEPYSAYERLDNFLDNVLMM